MPNGNIPMTQVVDQLPAGLAFVKLVSFTNNTSNDVSFTGDPTSPTVTNNGQTVTFNLGDVTNGSTDPNAIDSLTFDYLAVVLNVASNVTGKMLSNVAQVVWNNGANHSNTASAAPVTVIEPAVVTTKLVSGGGAFNGGDTITYAITLQQGNTVDANNVTLTDLLPQTAQRLVDHRISQVHGHGPVRPKREHKTTSSSPAATPPGGRCPPTPPTRSTSSPSSRTES